MKAWIMGAAAALLLTVPSWRCVAAPAGAPKTSADTPAAPAERELSAGVAYASGNGVAKDCSKASADMQDAALAGNAEAQDNLSFMYSNGLCVPKDPQLALYWIVRSAKAGRAQAQYVLAGMYQQGNGVGQSTASAVNWLQQAAEQGYVQAQVNLANFYMNAFLKSHQEPDIRASLKWARAAAAQGNSVVAEYLLCSAYYNAFGVARSLNTAAAWCQKATNHKDIPKDIASQLDGLFTAVRQASYAQTHPQQGGPR